VIFFDFFRGKPGKIARMKTADSVDLSQASHPGLMRRLAAMLYDGMLLFGVLTMATLLAMFILGEGPEKQIAAGHPLFQAYLLLTGIAFFVWFWVHGGQTLGMRAWRLRLLRSDGAPLTTGDALLRCLAALLSWATCGLGFLWILVDAEKLAWHDRLSKTQMVITTKK
jgi:uncharacterized RDD family membrane protein YckC